jgi:hypothetical protein
MTLMTDRPIIFEDVLKEMCKIKFNDNVNDV